MVLVLEMDPGTGVPRSVHRPPAPQPRGPWAHAGQPRRPPSRALLHRQPGWVWLVVGGVYCQTQGALWAQPTQCMKVHEGAATHLCCEIRDLVDFSSSETWNPSRGRDFGSRRPIPRHAEPLGRHRLPRRTSVERVWISQGHHLTGPGDAMQTVSQGLATRCRQGGHPGATWTGRDRAREFQEAAAGGAKK